MLWRLPRNHGKEFIARHTALQHAEQGEHVGYVVVTEEARSRMQAWFDENLSIDAKGRVTVIVPKGMKE